MAQANTLLDSRKSSMSMPKLHAFVTFACIALAGCASTSGLAPTATSRDANDVASHRALSDARIDAEIGRAHV